MLGLISAVHADPGSLDCPLRQIALDYAQTVQPAWRPLSAFQEFADALNGAQEAVDCHVKPTPSAANTASRARVAVFPLPKPSDAALVIFVDPTRGDDAGGDGSLNRPLASLHTAVGAVRAFRAERVRGRLSEMDRAVLVLRAGTFYLGASGSLQLGPADSFLTLQAHPDDEEVVISGGVPLEGLDWKAMPDAIPKRALYEYRSGMLGEGFDAASPVVMTVADGQAMCSSMPTCAGITYQGGGAHPNGEVKIYFKVLPPKCLLRVVWGRGPCCAMPACIAVSAPFPAVQAQPQDRHSRHLPNSDAAARHRS